MNKKNKCKCGNIKCLCSKTCQKCMGLSYKKPKHYCTCGQELSNYRTKNCSSCAAIKRIKKYGNSFKGKKHTEKTKQIISKKMTGKPGYWKGKHISKDAIDKRIKTLLKNGTYKGKNNPMYGVHRFGKNAANWIHGKGYEPYSTKFNKKLKDQIRERDNHTCQLCSKKGRDVHHIDYNKQNCKKPNLIILCEKCNSIVNYNRNYWKKILKNRIKIIYRMTKE